MTDSASSGLTKRVAASARIAFDDTQPLGTRVRAAAKLSGGIAGVGAAGLLGGDGIRALLESHSGSVGVFLAEPMAHAGEIGLGAGAGAAVLAYGLGFMVEEGSSSSTYRPERDRGHAWLGKSVVASAVATGAATLIGSGIAAVDATGLAHAGSVAGGFGDAAAAVGAATVAGLAARLVTRIGTTARERAAKAVPAVVE